MTEYVEDLNSFIKEFASEIKETGYSESQVRALLEVLVGIVGPKYMVDLVRQKLRGSAVFIHLMEFCEALKVVSKCEGFEKFIKEFHNIKDNEITRKGWEFELEVARFLVSRGLEITLKPDDNSDTIIKSQDMTVEAKGWVFDNELAEYHSNLSNLSLKIFEGIPNNIDVKIEIKGPPTDADMKEICRAVKVVSTNKTAIETDEFEVALNAEPNDFTGDHMVVSTHATEISPNQDRLPVAIIFSKSKKIIVVGRFSLLKKLQKKFDDARQQLKEGRKNLIFIDYNQALGSDTELCQAIAKKFSITKNTRISGVVLLEHVILDERMHYRVKIVINPYAKQKLEDDFVGKLLNLRYSSK